MVDKLTAALIENEVDVPILDPFISTHGVPENDNNAMDLVIKQFAAIADATNCAIDLVHHTRKLNGAEADMDSHAGFGHIGCRAVCPSFERDEQRRWQTIRNQRRRTPIICQGRQREIQPRPTRERPLDQIGERLAG
ncbi:MAG: AAA family ATPase [Paracoccaceae bacterium]